MMFLIVPLVLLVTGLWIGSRESKREHDTEAGLGLFTFGVISLAVWLIVATIMTFVGQAEQEGLVMANDNLTVTRELYENVVAIINAKASEYPIEEELLKSFEPTILLSLPEIKSDQFLTSQIKIAVQYQAEVTRLKIEINSRRRWVRIQRKRWIVPIFIRPELV